MSFDAAQICRLLYRRAALCGGTSLLGGAGSYRIVRRLKTCDTADCKSALRWHGRAWLDGGEPRSYVERPSGGGMHACLSHCMRPRIPCGSDKILTINWLHRCETHKHLYRNMLCCTALSGVPRRNGLVCFEHVTERAGDVSVRAPRRVCYPGL
jgi:hypothetical protein